MSTRPINFFLGQSDDPRQVELTRSLVEKARQGKIPWVKQANALTATIPLGLQVNFVLAPLNRKPELAVADGSGRKRE